MELSSLKETEKKYKELKKRYKTLEARKTVTKTSPRPTTATTTGHDDSGTVKKLEKKVLTVF